MGIENREPSQSPFLDEVANLARTLQAETASDAEKKTAREVLVGLRKKCDENILRLTTAKLELSGGTRDDVMYRQHQYDTNIANEKNYRRVINVALGLPEDDERRIE